MRLGEDRVGEGRKAEAGGSGERGTHAHRALHLVVADDVAVQRAQQDHGQHARQEQHDHHRVHQAAHNACLYQLGLRYAQQIYTYNGQMRDSCTRT